MPRRKVPSAQQSTEPLMDDRMREFIEAAYENVSRQWREDVEAHPAATHEGLRQLHSRARDEWSPEDEENLQQRFQDSAVKTAVDGFQNRDKAALVAVCKTSLQFQKCSPLEFLNPLSGCEAAESGISDEDYPSFTWKRVFSENLEDVLLIDDFWDAPGVTKLRRTLDFVGNYNARTEGAWKSSGRCKVLEILATSYWKVTVGQRLKRAFEQVKDDPCKDCDCRLFYEFVTQFPSTGRPLRYDEQLKKSVAQITAKDLQNLVQAVDSIHEQRKLITNRQMRLRLYKKLRGAHGLPSIQQVTDFQRQSLLKYGQNRALEIKRLADEEKKRLEARKKAHGSDDEDDEDDNVEDDDEDEDDEDDGDQDDEDDGDEGDYDVTDDEEDDEDTDDDDTPPIPKLKRKRARRGSPAKGTRSKGKSAKGSASAANPGMHGGSTSRSLFDSSDEAGRPASRSGSLPSTTRLSQGPDYGNDEDADFGMGGMGDQGPHSEHSNETSVVKDTPRRALENERDLRAGGGKDVIMRETPPPRRSEPQSPFTPLRLTTPRLGDPVVASRVAEHEDEDMDEDDVDPCPGD